jgi:hypothetical protein
MLQSHQKRFSMVQCLIDNGADVNAASKKVWLNEQSNYIVSMVMVIILDDCLNRMDILR